jgi:CubicO group peptidase (beta-lactamase class C family)
MIDAWPVDRAAVAVIGPDGVRATVGDTGSFGWASVTKVVTALAVLDVVADGLLSLDAAAGPEGSTLRHLLAHAWLSLLARLRPGAAAPLAERA